MNITFCQMYDKNNERYMEQLALAEIKFIKKTMIKESPYHLRNFLEIFMESHLKELNISIKSNDGKKLNLAEQINIFKDKGIADEIIISAMHEIRMYGNKVIHQEITLITETDIRKHLLNAYKIVVNLGKRDKAFKNMYSYFPIKEAILTSKIFLKLWEIEHENDDFPKYKQENLDWKIIESKLGVCKSYREDKDLEFLKKCKNEDLENLYKILVYDPQDGNKRVTEELSSNIKVKTYEGRYSLFWKEIAAEFQLYGGNTLTNFFRKKGVVYKEIISDVCDQLKIRYHDKNSVYYMEELLIKKIFKDVYENSDIEEKTEILKTLKLSDVIEGEVNALDILQGLSTVSIVFRKQMIVMMEKIIMKQLLKFTTKKAIQSSSVMVAGKILASAVGPAGTLWTLYDLSGPAYRVTTFAVLEIALLRRRIEAR